MSNIFLIGIAQALFFVFLLFNKKGKSLSDKVLIGWLLFLAAHLLTAYGDSENWHTYSLHWLGFSFPFPAAEGPFFYLYVITLTRNPSRIYWYDYLHFLPFFLLYFITWDYFSMTGPEKLYFMTHVLWNDPPLTSHITRAIVTFTGPAYAAYVLWQLRQHRQNIKAFFSYSDEIDLKWIQILAMGMFLIWVVVWIVLLFQGGENERIFKGEGFIYIAVTLFVFAIGYFGLQQGRIFSFKQDIPSERDSSKYKNSGLRQEKREMLTHKILSYVESEKPYLNPQLTLSELANNLDLSSHHLSQLINEDFNQNFFEFINQYRVSAFQEAVKNPANKHLTLLAIAMDCGFNSKSSFNRTFKQLTGETPSQYAQKALPRD